MDLYLSIVLNGGSGSSLIHADQGVRQNGPENRYASVMDLSDGMRHAIAWFSRVRAYLEQKKVCGKIELVVLDNQPMLRAKRRASMVAYHLFHLDTPPQRIASFLARRGTVFAPVYTLASGRYNLVTGRNAEKFLHEWLSHPVEEGEPLPAGVSMWSVPPHFYSSHRKRLVRGRITCDKPVQLPEKLLLVRTVDDGHYDHSQRRIYFSVTEAFLKEGILLKSVYPARFSTDLDQLTQGFAGCLTEQQVTGPGFICRKFGELVFGHIESPALLFTNVPLELEE